MWIIHVWAEQVPEGEGPLEWIRLPLVPIEPLMLAVLAQRCGGSPATTTVGTDLGRKWHAPMMARRDGELSGKVGSLYEPLLPGVHLAFHLRL